MLSNYRAVKNDLQAMADIDRETMQWKPLNQSGKSA